jgi:hypothetical protein
LSLKNKRHQKTKQNTVFSPGNRLEDMWTIFIEYLYLGIGRTRELRTLRIRFQLKPRRKVVVGLLGNGARGTGHFGRQAGYWGNSQFPRGQKKNIQESKSNGAN